MATTILAEQRRAPAVPGGALTWAKRNLFDTPGNAVMTVLMLGLFALVIPPLAHEWARVKGDGWTHAGIVYQILERGVPPEDPRWAGQIMNYVWFYNFFIALLTGVRHSDPFTFMVLLNVCDLFAFLGLAYLTAWAVWRDGRIATWAVVLTAFGLNAGAWLLWPLRAIRGITGSVRGTQAVLDALAVDVTSWRVLYALNAPFSHMVSFLDKFMIGTAINYAWIQMDLAIWAVLAWVADRNGLPPPAVSPAGFGAMRMARIDAIADVLEAHLDLDRIVGLIAEGAQR